MKHYLIDSENVGDFWIPLLDLPAECAELIVFYTKNSPHMSYDSLIKLKESDRIVKFIKCYEGTNALDFQLCSELGFLIAGNEDDDFIIVTNDTGYDAAVKYWRHKEYSVKRIAGKDSRTGSRRKGMPARYDVAAEVNAILHKLSRMPEIAQEEDNEPEQQEDVSAALGYEGEENVDADSADLFEAEDEGIAENDEADKGTEDDEIREDEEDEEYDSDSDLNSDHDPEAESDLCDELEEEEAGDDTEDSSASSEEESQMTGEAVYEESVSEESAPEEIASEKTDPEEIPSEEMPSEEILSEDIVSESSDSEEKIYDPSEEEDDSGLESREQQAVEAEVPDTEREGSEDFVPDMEEITAIVNCIGMDNLAELHNQLIQFYADKGKDIYQSLKNGTLFIEKQDWDKEEKFLYYCAMILRHSDEPKEALTEESITELAKFLLGAENKRKNLNSLRYALIKHYGQEKGRRYYFMLKPYVKALNQM